jgi:hypothetical protein
MPLAHTHVPDPEESSDELDEEEEEDAITMQFSAIKLRVCE